MSGLIGQLVGYWLDDLSKQNQAQQRQEQINRAAAMLGYQGANPNETDINSRLHGGGPDPARMTSAEMQALNQRYADLAAAEDRNKPTVEQYRLQSALADAAGKPAPTLDEFYKAAVAAKLPAIMNQLSVRQQVDALNNKALGDPYTLQGGVTANTETGQIAGYSPEIAARAQEALAKSQSEQNRQGMMDAHAGLYQAQAQTEQNRRGELDAQALASTANAYLNSTKRQEILDRTDALQKYFDTRDPRYLEKATGRAAPMTGVIVKGRVNGVDQLFRTGVDANGQTRYYPAQTDTNQPVAPTGAAGRGPSTLEQNVDLIVRTTGATPQQALQILLNKSNSRAQREVFQNQPASQPQAPTVTQVDPRAVLLEQARQAIAQGADVEKVKERLRQLAIDPSGL